MEDEFGAFVEGFDDDARDGFVFLVYVGLLNAVAWWLVLALLRGGVDHPEQGTDSEATREVDTHLLPFLTGCFVLAVGLACHLHLPLSVLAKAWPIAAHRQMLCAVAEAVFEYLFQLCFACLFFLVPFAFFHYEAIGLAGTSLPARVAETAVVLTLVAGMLQGMVWLVQQIFELHTTNLTFSTTIVSYVGSMMHLVTCPVGVAKIITATTRLYTNINILNSQGKKIAMFQLEEDALELQLQRAQAVPTTLRPHTPTQHAADPPSPLALSSFSPSTQFTTPGCTPLSPSPLALSVPNKANSNAPRRLRRPSSLVSLSEWESRGQQSARRGRGLGPPRPTPAPFLPRGLPLSWRDAPLVSPAIKHALESMKAISSAVSSRDASARGADEATSGANPHHRHKEDEEGLGGVLPTTPPCVPVRRARGDSVFATPRTPALSRSSFSPLPSPPPAPAPAGVPPPAARPMSRTISFPLLPLPPPALGAPATGLGSLQRAGLVGTGCCSGCGGAAHARASGATPWTALDLFGRIPRAVPAQAGTCPWGGDDGQGAPLAMRPPPSLPTRLLPIHGGVPAARRQRHDDPSATRRTRGRRPGSAAGGRGASLTESIQAELERVRDKRQRLQQDLRTPAFHNILFLLCLSAVAFLTFQMLLRPLMVRVLGKPLVEGVRLWARTIGLGSPVRVEEEEQCWVHVWGDLLGEQECKDTHQAVLPQSDWATRFRSLVHVLVFSTNFQTVGWIDLGVVVFFTTACMVGLHHFASSVVGRSRGGLKMQELLVWVGVLLVSGLSLALAAHNLGINFIRLADVLKTPELAQSATFKMWYSLGFVVANALAVVQARPHLDGETLRSALRYLTNPTPAD